MSFIKELSKQRSGWIKSSRENDFEEGIKNLLTELYPDNAHFIYELLQNAEDAGATKVNFILNLKGLRFSHNGKRDFTEADIKAITSIANSNKKDDFNQIGKFGVGFKAVFSYTQTPQIYSGEYSFEIHDLVNPVEIKRRLSTLIDEKDATIFWFPFNHPQKLNQKAVEEIEETFENLPDTTLLFLRNISEIKWKIERENERNGLIKRSPTENQNIFEIIKDIELTEKTNWLQFKKAVPEKLGQFVGIAFKLTLPEDKKNKQLERLKIDSSVGNGQVAIYFPADKENSNLRFNIHAPFAATVARDSIQSRDENNYLRDLLVAFLIESLPKIKKLGMLDLDFLEILPNNKDELSKFYIPFRDGIIRAFQEENYTPTWKKRFLPAHNLAKQSGKPQDG